MSPSQHQKWSLHSLCCHLKHLLLELNETESASKMDKAQCQEIKPLSCWRAQSPPCSHYQEQSCLTWQLCLLLPLSSQGTATGMAADSSSPACPASSLLPRNHVAGAPSASSKGLQGGDRESSSSFCSRSCAQAPLAQNLWGLRPLLAPGAQCLAAGVLIWKTNCHTSELYHTILSFMDFPPVRRLIN